MGWAFLLGAVILALRQLDKQLAAVVILLNPFSFI